MGREGGKIWTLIVFFIFVCVSFVQGEILKKTLINPDLQKREIKRKTHSGTSSGIRTKSSNFPSVGSHKTSTFHCRREKKSDLSIKRVYVKDCYIHVVIKNEGKGKLKNTDWVKGKLILKIKSSRKSGVKKIRNYAFSLKQVDPSGYLKKPGKEVDFNTKILCKESMWVRVRLKNLKRDGKRGCKQLSLNLFPPEACTGSEGRTANEEMDPCSEALNPRCEPRSCRTADGRAGRCSMVGGSCICMAEE